MYTKTMSHRLAHIDFQFEPFLSRSLPKWWSHTCTCILGPISSKVSRFRRETLHGRLKKRLHAYENDRALKKWTAGGRGWTPRRDWSRRGRAAIDSIFYTNMKIVRHDCMYLFVIEGGVTLGLGRVILNLVRYSTTKFSTSYICN
jgi:hypothetical protein